MVVLEGGGGMLTTGSNQYLQPDYLSPLPTTLDAKKSPLALLAQTCSQIGADSPNAKPLITPLEKTKKSSGGGGDAASASPPAHKTPAQPPPQARASPQEPRLAFKPYEANVLTKKCPEEPRPPSKAGSATHDDEKKSSSRSSSRKSASPQSTTPDVKPPPPPPVEKSASPIVRSGLEVLQGHPKDLPLGASAYKPSLGLAGSSLSALCSGCPPGLDPANPAFRPPFAGAFSHHHAAMLAAAGYPAAPGPYVSYARVKTASGGEALVPVCKDPYCTGCQFSVHSQQLAAAAASVCPSGCTQCDHQKYGLAAALSGLVPAPLGYPHLAARPYVCNWIAGDSYCGKRFAASDELLQHLRTHTSLSADAAAAAAAAAAAPMSLLGAPHSFLHRAAYPNPPLSPLSASRYHPYSKPGLPASLAASPFSAFNPTALGPYYSPYSLYGQRIGAAVHQ